MNSSINFICNDADVSADVNLSNVTLDFLRHQEHLTGVKEGCREGDCGACTILIGELREGSLSYINVNSCLLPLASAAGKHLVTIEGVSNKELNLIQKIIVEEGASQCGFCTPGLIMSLTAYLITAETYNYEDAINFIAGNICRCTGYISIKRAVKKIIDHLRNIGGDHNRIDFLTANGLLPSYFRDIRRRLEQLQSKIKAVSNNDIKGFMIAGGTDLYVQKETELQLSENYFLESDPYIKQEDNNIVISASASVSDIRNSEIINHFLPHIKEYLDLFGSEPIRNKATLGGNICNASPSADLVSIFLALDSFITLQSNGRRRDIMLRNFFKDYKVIDIRSGEILKELYFKMPKETGLFNFEKVSRRTNLDIASVNTSLYIETGENHIITIHVSAGGVAPTPLYLSKTVSFLSEKHLDQRIIFQAAEVLQEEISPISDIRGSVEYKRLLMRQLFLAHFIKLFPLIFIREESNA